ncbi:glycoside hydrolase family 3 N-terminal domain-containing protein [Pseudoflavonifractor sp. CLA-AP-H29]|uniref:Glycoside hydrolase family 3 N-terminal domain-containing protein n=1 Tax=Pseudoflavonifractor intestinihominis TaxID=3133171 RepID=A0ABV1E4Y7_9FIRM
MYGNITAGASTLGSAGIRVPGSAGETSEALEASRQIPSLIMADGPAGLRLRQCYQADRATGEVYGAGVLGSLENGFLEAPPRHESADTYYQFCTAFPVGTALAQSWDPDLLAQVGRAVSREMDEFHVDLWLAPGMNIQRNPLCGRNFEYYSEDPLLTGTLAAAITAGVQESGRHGVPLKHFACNNQEDNRMAVDARVSERALREIYLRGFEIAVKAAAPAAVMSAYNCINGVHAANSRDLCTVVLRQEWGFAGLVMSDWNTTVPQDGSTPWRCAWAGNDVIMPGNPHDDADIRAALADGRLPETAARQSAARLIALASALRGG